MTLTLTTIYVISCVILLLTFLGCVFLIKKKRSSFTEHQLDEIRCFSRWVIYAAFIPFVNTIFIGFVLMMFVFFFADQLIENILE